MPPLMSNQYEATYNNNNQQEHQEGGSDVPVIQPNKKRRLNPLTVSVPSSKKKTVTFAPHLMAHKNIDKTQDEITSSWYSRDEMETLKKERNDFVKALHQVQWNLDAIDPNQHFMRGFESYFSQKLNRDLRARRELVVKRVMEEQQRQPLTRRDDESIRAVSLTVSQHAQNRALDLGAQDADETWMEALQDMALAGDDCGGDDDNSDYFDYSIVNEFTTLVGFLPLQPLPCS